MKVSEALTAILRELERLSGYPDHTVEDPVMAFAYGLVIGGVMMVQKDWERREEEQDVRTRKAKDRQ